MKKLLGFIVILLLAVGCTQSLPDTKMDSETASMPIAAADSSQWQMVKMYEGKYDVIYLKKNKTVYKVEVGDVSASTGLTFILITFAFVVGLFIGSLDR